jgi:hypothetical protein
MKDENFITQTLLTCEKVRIEDCPESLFYVLDNTILAIHNNTTRVLYCKYEQFWGYVNHIPNVGIHIKEGYNKNTTFTDCIIARPGLYQGNYLKRKRSDIAWDWETICINPNYFRNPISSTFGDFS